MWYGISSWVGLIILADCYQQVLHFTRWSKTCYWWWEAVFWNCCWKRKVLVYIIRLNCWICVLITVPIVVVFTKFDALVTKCWGELGEARMQPDANDIAAQKAKTRFKADYLPLVMNTEYSPKTHVLLGGMFTLASKALLIIVLGMDKEENKCPELSVITASALDNTVLQNLFVSTQMNNLDLCTKYAIK